MEDTFIEAYHSHEWVIFPHNLHRACKICHKEVDESRYFELLIHESRLIEAKNYWIELAIKVLEKMIEERVIMKEKDINEWYSIDALNKAIERIKKEL